ncbi:MAG: hypothetical protein PQJ59_17905 [Spirochaetales bacterium]|nr:hypothetical protein [Spirochaetales bacterium]
MIVEFDPLALFELNDAVEYYNFKLSGLGDRFRKDVGKGIDRIIEYPKAWQCQTSRTRRFLLNLFPFKTYDEREKVPKLKEELLGILHSLQ